MKPFIFKDLVLTPQAAMEYLENNSLVKYAFKKDYELEGNVRCLLAYIKELQSNQKPKAEES